MPTASRQSAGLDAISRELLAVIDARGNRNSFSYDAAGRQVLSTDALGNMITSQFDAASRQTLRINRHSLRTSYTYDAASRLVGKRYPGRNPFNKHL